MRTLERGGIELDEHGDVAVWAEVVAQNGPKKSETPG
jgi:hypothetical protein